MRSSGRVKSTASSLLISFRPFSCKNSLFQRPKQYAYQTSDIATKKNIKTVVKVRGVTIDSMTSKQLTLSQMWNMVAMRSDEVVVTRRTQFRRDDKGVFTREEEKRYRTVSTKNVRRADDSIVPFGYRDPTV